ncbi:F-box protein [Apostasia shenzhenica]|uniref:F-box protein n=1 Tax=Apostasia shenzhenica TaxID=1088818 RepID=A0A2I0A1V1_9ASPA|nr:F-box protein [Apostasia shenzhenica]
MKSMEEALQRRDRRPDALGDFCVLPDELICTLLELLSPSDIGRLSCVSRKNFYTKTEVSQKHPLQFDGFNSVFLYRRWYRCFTSLDMFSLDSRDVERRANLSMEEFQHNYDGKRPVLLTEVAGSWPARYKWTLDQLLSNYGDAAFRISQRSSKKITMKFKDYVFYMKCQHDEDPLYVFDDKFGEVAPALLQDYSVPHLFQEDFFDVLDYDQRPPFKWLIIGPERSGASWHVDPGLTSAWNTLLCGRKRWALYPPGRVPVGVTVHVDEANGEVNIDSPSSLQWWLDFYPLLADDDKPLECTQHPGETIFVPSGWWHCVLNLETTIAVTQNFVNASNFEFVCLDMAPGHVHKGVCRAGLLAVQDGVCEFAKSDASLRTNPFDMTRREKRLKVSQPGKQQHGHHGSWNSIGGHSEAYNNYNQEFSYDIDFISMFLDREIDHYSFIWSPSNIIGEREMRVWLHKLWVLKPAMRQLTWKGACLALNVEKWAACLLKICSNHTLPFPLDYERFPLGIGSNPVFLLSDFVIKIYVEGGLGYAIHGLGTELEFHSLLHSVNSSLMDHVPDVVASGILTFDGSGYETFAWNGRGVPEIIANSNLVHGGCRASEFPFGVWCKKQYEMENHGDHSYSSVWPYVVSRRCKGEIFAHVRDLLSMTDAVNLASFLGEQLHHLHLLPVPKNNFLEISTGRMIINDSGRFYKVPSSSMEVDLKISYISQKWRLVIAALDRRKDNIKGHLAQWGTSIPDILIDKVEEYIPDDLLDDGGSFNFSPSLSWLHSDIMDDNIHMEWCLGCSDESSLHSRPTVNDSPDACNGKVTVNGTSYACNEEGKLRAWRPTHILDFSDLSIGDPLLDLIPIYLDVFRGEKILLRKLLESYKLPLGTKSSVGNGPSSGLPENYNKFNRLSYRAISYLCYLRRNDEVTEGKFSNSSDKITLILEIAVCTLKRGDPIDRSDNPKPVNLPPRWFFSVSYSYPTVYGVYGLYRHLYATLRAEPPLPEVGVEPDGRAGEVVDLGQRMRYRDMASVGFAGLHNSSVPLPFFSCVRSPLRCMIFREAPRSYHCRCRRRWPAKPISTERFPMLRCSCRPPAQIPAAVKKAGQGDEISRATLLWRAAKLPIYSVALVPLSGICCGLFSDWLLLRQAICSALGSIISDYYLAKFEADNWMKQGKVAEGQTIFSWNNRFHLDLLQHRHQGGHDMESSSGQAGDIRFILLVTSAILCGTVLFCNFPWSRTTPVILRFGLIDLSSSDWASIEPHGSSCPPFRLSYQGLGEPLCFSAFGPFATTAFYFSQSPKNLTSGMNHLPLNSTVISASILVGLTTTCILFCSHFHQIDGDQAVGKMSPLVRIGTEIGSKVVRFGILSLYILLFAFSVCRTLPLTCALLCAITVPLATVVVKFVEQNRNDKVKIFMAKYLCVRLHSLFGMALATGLVIARAGTTIAWLQPVS